MTLYLLLNPQEAMKHTGSTTRAAVQLSPVDRNDVQKVQQAAYYTKELIKARFFLVDLPDVLAAGFVDHLRRLQHYHASGDFPFSDSISPRAEGLESASQPPKYALKPGFKFDLNCLRDPQKRSPSEDLVLTPGSGAGLQSVKDLTTLDDGQAVALFENLDRRIAFTQGPPGTGKTFLGVAESEVILKSQPQCIRKPIVVVCMTNHALDDFVASLVRRNINKIVRVGTRSACEWMEKYLLNTVSRRVKPNNNEKRARMEARSQSENLSKLGTEWADEFSGEVGIRTLQGYLTKKHPDIANQFDYLDRVGIRGAEYHLLTRSSAGYAFKYWISGGDLTGIATLVGSTSEACNAAAGNIDVDAHATVQKVLNGFKEKVASSSDACQHIWNLDLAGRQELLGQWRSEINEWSLCEAFAEIHRRQQAARARLRHVMQRLDVRSILEQKIDIIALTATGCARNWDFLNMLEPHTFLMEEASELTEASTIAALVPSAQHLIKIGDPYQLRPHISLQSLCKENDDRYKLDESLFERLMGSVPFSRLNTQRRAHPELADLLRAGDYPYLVDHSSTKARPEVPGLFSRLYWVHHENPEDAPDPLSAMAKSFSNRWEVAFICSVVKYLIERQGFRYNTMTILTPYNGQVALFVKSLKSFCKVALTKEDKEALVDAGLLEADELDNNSATSVELGSLLRVTTVDNYQGEENDVVFFSPVRSNPEGKAGFLKNQNRVNVAISRARNGFFIVGNATLLESVPQWAPVVSTFKHKSAISKGLPVQQCSKHDLDEGHGVMKVSHPDKFRYIATCHALCGQTLLCGHSCRELCHPAEMHDDGRITCTHKCNKTLPCGHRCKKLCGENCEPCTERLEATILFCGHLVHPPCGTDVRTYKCTRSVGDKVLNCGHTKIITCENKEKELSCTEICNRVLECGHRCPQQCHVCVSDGGCQTCTQPCAKNLPCGHACASKCHSDTACPACIQPCLRGCRHGKCKLPCNVVCDPCIRQGQSTSCPHQEKSILCCLPGTSVPCPEKCTRTLFCGLHVCPGMCGEPCPSTCLECSGKKPIEKIYALPCEHVFAVKELDQMLGLDTLYTFATDGSITGISVKGLPSPSQLRCPTCGSSTNGAPRYALAHQVVNGQEIVGRLCAKVSRHLRQLAKTITGAEERLFHDLPGLCARIKPGPLALRHNQAVINRRMAEIVETQRDVTKIRDELAQPIEEAVLKFTRLMDNSTMFPVPVLGLTLRSNRLYHRCRFIVTRFLSMATTQLKKVAGEDEYMGLLTQVLSGRCKEFADDIASLDPLVAECQAKHLKRLEVEFLIAKTASVILARNLGLPTPVMTGDLQKASVICATYPNSAGRLRANLTDAKNFIMSGISSLKLDDTHQAESRHYWEVMGKQDRNNPDYCKYGHLFSAETFPQGCPECGEERRV